jgi:hypothetical protein
LAEKFPVAVADGAAFADAPVKGGARHGGEGAWCLRRAWERPKWKWPHILEKAACISETKQKQSRELSCSIYGIDRLLNTANTFVFFSKEIALL